MKEMGDQVQIEVTPLIPYHSFANFLLQSTGEEQNAKSSDVAVNTAKDGIFYWLIFHIEYAGKILHYED